MNVEKPKIIYLHIENAWKDERAVGDYTWSQNKIYESDLKYVLVEEKERVIPVQRRKKHE